MDPKEQQLTILNDDQQSNGSPERLPKKTYEKICEECGKQYHTVSQGAKFCSSFCRGRYFRKMKPTNTPTTSDTKPAFDKPVQSITPTIAGMPPHIQIAVDLLKKDSERMEKAYNEERDRRRKAETELQKLKDDVRDREHKKALEGLEEKKPDWFDRLANLPTPVLEQFAPVLGRLAGMLVPGGEGAQQMAGVGGQLDEAQVQFLSWIAALPEELQKNFMAINAALTHMDENTLAFTLTQIQNLLVNGSTVSKAPSLTPSLGYDKTMYGG
ncbi:MAG TPA: hypothetical protein VK589_30045 [Chryseolinea sp.]|nr:hypothetical protein [Chryseolinea sp.]